MHNVYSVHSALCTVRVVPSRLLTSFRDMTRYHDITAMDEGSAPTGFVTRSQYRKATLRPPTDASSTTAPEAGAELGQNAATGDRSSKSRRPGRPGSGSISQQSGTRRRNNATTLSSAATLPTAHLTSATATSRGTPSNASPRRRHEDGTAWPLESIATVQSRKREREMKLAITPGFPDPQIITRTKSLQANETTERLHHPNAFTLTRTPLNEAVS